MVFPSLTTTPSNISLLNYSIFPPFFCIFFVLKCHRNMASLMMYAIERSLHALHLVEMTRVLRLVKTTGGYLSCRPQWRHLVPLMPRTRPLPGLSCFHAREAKTCTFFGGRGKACVVVPYVQESVSKAYIYVLTSSFSLRSAISLQPSDIYSY